MDSCYLGESFELSFDCYDRRDRSRPVDSATYAVRTSDGAIVQGGTMSKGDDPNVVSFRFNATVAGMLTITVSWTMGQDRFQERFLLQVRE